MAVFNISEELSSKISAKLIKMNKNEKIKYINQSDEFNVIVEYIKNALKSDLFVLVKNIGFNNDKLLFELFVKRFGNKYYGLVEHTDIKLDCPYYGCTSNYLDMHNDNAIDINYPTYGFIQVIKEDPLKLPQNGIVRIDDIVNYLYLYDKRLLDMLLTHPVPMLSYGIYYDEEDKQKILLNMPVLYKDDNIYKSRLDLSRIRYYYWKTSTKQKRKEKIMIDKFLRVAQKCATYFYLEESDILIHHNQRTMHDRKGCSFEINENLEVETREIFVSFMWE